MEEGFYFYRSNNSKWMICWVRRGYVHFFGQVSQEVGNEYLTKHVEFGEMVQLPQPANYSIKCELCEKEIINDPYIEKVWKSIAKRLYWHTNCFVYIHPIGAFPPPIFLGALIEAYKTKSL